MPLPKETYVVGCFENISAQVYPTHVRPILAERKDGEFRRLFCFYGKDEVWMAVHNSEFSSRQNILRFSDFVKTEPQPFKDGYHTVLMDNGRLFVGNRVSTVIRMIPLCFSRQRQSAWQTILNAVIA